jgi:hypothetical protein
MSFMDVLTVISLIASIVSIVLAIMSMISSSNSEKETRNNFEKTKDILHKIETESAVINQSIQKNLTDITTLFSNVLDKVIQEPKNEQFQPMSTQEIDKIIEDDDERKKQDDFSNQLAMQLLPELIKNPDSLSKLVEISEKLNQKK